ncbi:MAG: phosphoenolpyruvate--protein phosphotransferase [Actinobacteria bacterium]|nr:MAG: phosphoenolpyruvate--protein phosphotransferase [Actinomycetota bacterium]
MIGIVLVSHSPKVAEGVAELAREMGGAEVRLEPVGGLDLPDRPMGTDAVLVMQAIERAWSEDGVLVLMDLGSAVLSAEMALDMLPPDRKERVLLCEAPFVEGAVAAAVAAKLGRSLQEAAEEARGGLGPKATHLGTAAPVPAVPESGPAAGPQASVRLSVDNPLGLHARPAARFVQTAGRFDAEVRVTNLTTGAGPANARSLNAVATLGVRQGHEIEVVARGPEAQAAIDAVGALAAVRFGDDVVESRAPAAARSDAGPAEAWARVPVDGALSGLPASPGVAVGPARHLRPPDIEVPSGPAGEPKEEWAALEEAIEATRVEISATRASVAARADEQSAAIFDAHLLFLEDEELIAPVRAAVLDGGRGAGEAWKEAVDRVAETWRALDDPYLRERAADVEAVGVQVLAHLVGGVRARPALAGGGVLIAADLTPADTAGLDPAIVVGIATALGGPTSHSAILARSLGIPAVVGLGPAVLGITEGATVIVDGEKGAVRSDPTPEQIAEAERRAESFRASEAAARAEATRPAVTRDGTPIEVLANVGQPADVESALGAGAEGVGLLRTEFLFIGRQTMPSEQEQEAVYRGIAEALQARPLILRTLDVGGDKPLPYLPVPHEANPFLGLRGLRLGLARPDVLREQLRAVLRVAADHPVKVMFPMVTSLVELRAAKALVEEARDEVEAAGGRAPSHLEVGIMVEVPAAALAAGVFASEADFFSIGTNDLTQYTLAAERGNERVAGLADALHPAVLRLIRMTVEGAGSHGRTVGVCGEIAADPVAVPVLVGLGVRELSVAPPAVPRVKRAVRETDLGSARTLADHAIELDSADAVRTAAAG